MTAIQANTMNIELWQSIGAIADNEELMSKLTKYAKKLVKEKKDPTLFTKDEFMTNIEEARKGSTMMFDSIEELDKHISSL